jgi:L-Ala-D/L-Glu epimerase
VPHLGLLKLKLGGDGDQQRMRAVRAARPDARLIADANEAWPETQVLDLLHTAASLNFELIEQPLPANADHMLAAIVRPVPVCADEAAHDAAGVPALVGRYDAVNIKLDKTGGLTPALDMMAVARKHGLRVMVGCMVATSLSMAPALVLAADATWVDLDGPLLLASDRAEGLTITDGWIEPARADLWG